MSPSIVLHIDGNYTNDLRERLKEYGITHGELSRESGINPSQLSRWFNTSIQPRLENVQRIEQAVARIRAHRKKERKRA